MPSMSLDQRFWRRTTAFVRAIVLAIRGHLQVERSRWNPSALDASDVIWAYRILLDRDPESAALISSRLRQHPTVSSLRQEILDSAEFRQRSTWSGPLPYDAIVMKELEGFRLCLNLSDSTTIDMVLEATNPRSSRCSVGTSSQETRSSTSCPREFSHPLGCGLA